MPGHASTRLNLAPLAWQASAEGAQCNGILDFDRMCAIAIRDANSITATDAASRPMSDAIWVL